MAWAFSRVPPASIGRLERLSNPEGAPPLARGRDRGLRPLAGQGVPDLPRPASKSLACAARVIPLPGRRPSPCYPRSRRLADGQGCSAALSPKRGGGDHGCTEIHRDRRQALRDLLQRRREQLAAVAKIEQP